MRSKLSEARDSRGWSQARLVSELERRGRAVGIPVMSQTSLKTALSRWENGHVIPDEHYRRLFRDIYELSDADLGLEGANGSNHEAPRDSDTYALDQLLESSLPLRRHLDSFPGDQLSRDVLESLEDRVELQSHDCISLAPATMLRRLLADFHEVDDFLTHPQPDKISPRLYRVAASYASLIADELMVLGRPADAQAWHTSAKAAADRCDDPPCMTRTRSLNALLYVYFGRPERAVALAQQAQGLSGDHPTPGSALAAAIEAFAHSQLGDAQRSQEAIAASWQQLESQRQEDSIFGFTERRWLFYRSRALLRTGSFTEARSAVTDAIASYPSDVVGDPAVIRLYLARRLAKEGDLIGGTEMATEVLTGLRPEHRTGLFVNAGRRVLTMARPLGPSHPAVQTLATLTEPAAA